MQFSTDVLIHSSFGLVVTVAALLVAAPSQAQTFDPRYPVCMHVYAGASDGGGGG
jgi:hypothetical protein